jgi:hypothetical protein
MSVVFPSCSLFRPVTTTVTGASEIPPFLLLFYFGFLLIFLEVVSRQVDIWQQRSILLAETQSGVEGMLRS